jgi:hypothetical protein
MLISEDCKVFFIALNFRWWILMDTEVLVLKKWVNVAISRVAFALKQNIPAFYLSTG